jgi:hypothetical protein
VRQTRGGEVGTRPGIETDAKERVETDTDEGGLKRKQTKGVEHERGPEKPSCRLVLNNKDFVFFFFGVTTGRLVVVATMSRCVAVSSCR